MERSTWLFKPCKKCMKIYFSGSIYGGRQKLETYQTLIKALKQYGEILNEEIADSQVIEKEKQTTDEHIFESLEKRLQEADIIFAELTIPSIGVGYELGYADSHNKKIIGIYDTTIVPKITTMVRGNKRIKTIPYTDINEIISQLDKILENF